MDLRTPRVKRPDGQVDEYLRWVESQGNNGRPRHRVVGNLGRKEVLAPQADALWRLLKGEGKTPAVNREAVAVGAWDWGVMLAARHFWRERGREAILDSLTNPQGRGQPLADRALALVANRWSEPRREQGLARWWGTDLVWDRWGRRCSRGRDGRGTSGAFQFMRGARTVSRHDGG